MSNTDVRPIPMRDALLEKIWREMSQDSRIFFVTADFGSPVLDKIRADFPNRFINVGIAEQNLINISSGLSLEGFKVFAYAIAPFITMRCFEQIRVNLALLSEVREINVNLIGVGAGYSYVVSGPTHQCYEDLTIIRSLPNIEILSPSDHISASAIFSICQKRNSVKYIRLDAQTLPVIYKQEDQLTSHGFVNHMTGNDLLIISTGFCFHTAKKVIEGLSSLSIGLIDMINLTSFNEMELIKSLQKYQYIVSIEEGFEGRGGLDSLLSDLIRKHKIECSFLNIGVNPGYRFELGSRELLHEQVGIGPESIKKRINLFLSNLKGGK